MKTTVVLPDDVFRRAKAETAMRGRTLRSFILDAIVHELDGISRETAVQSRVHLPLVRSHHPGSLKITADTVAEAMQAEDVHAPA